MHKELRYFKLNPNIALEPTKNVWLDENSNWHVPESLKFIKKIGSGAYGIVASFTDTKFNRNIAIKKIGDAFNDLMDAKRILREVKILRFLDHPNIIKILDILPPSNPNFEDIYLVSELMKSDLHKIIHSNQELTDNHYRIIIYQILNGLYYLNSANILHRDLKPSNILLNMDCEVKICDFGLARAPSLNSNSKRSSNINNTTITGSHLVQNQFNNKNDNVYRRYLKKDICQGKFDKDNQLTEYVVTRWYRSPEVILYPKHYDKSIDIWSLGCIFAELLGRQVIFAGDDSLDQIRQIIKIMGTPNLEDLNWLPPGITRDRALKYIHSLPKLEGKSFSLMFPQASELCIDLLERMLKFNPEERITVEEALDHEYLKGIKLHQKSICSNPIDWSFDNVKLTKRELQNKIYEEMALFNPAIITRDRSDLIKCGIQLDIEKIFQKSTFSNYPRMN